MLSPTSLRNKSVAKSVSYKSDPQCLHKSVRQEPKVLNKSVNQSVAQTCATRVCHPTMSVKSVFGERRASAVRVYIRVRGFNLALVFSDGA